MYLIESKNKQWCNDSHDSNTHQKTKVIKPVLICSLYRCYCNGILLLYTRRFYLSFIILIIKYLASTAR